ncbi:MAG: RAD55 family ATPase [Candidatus Thermoplasmatota archaeon]|nr:RAD55 family ATPase [Candidatus Thermoplasmatota archaeon]
MPTTGIPKLDSVLMDGIPEGFSVLVVGSPGSGTELFAKQFAGAAVKGEKALYFTTTEGHEEVKATMRSYGWREDIEVISIATQYYEKVLSKELEASRLKREGLSISDIAKLTLGEEHEEVNFLETLTYELSKQKGGYRVAIDSLDFFLEHYPSEDVLSALRAIVTHIHYTKGVALLTLAKDVYDKRIENAIAAIVDCLIELEVLKIGTGFENRLIIKKVKNQPQKMATLIYSITEKGITPELITRIG